MALEEDIEQKVWKFCEANLKGTFHSTRSKKTLKLHCSLDRIDRKSAEGIATLLSDLVRDLSPSEEKPRIEVEFSGAFDFTSITFRPDGQMRGRWIMNVEMSKVLPWELRNSLSYLSELDQFQTLYEAKKALKPYCTLSPKLILTCKMGALDRLSESDVTKLFDDLNSQYSAVEETIRRELRRRGKE
jgi:hypothetical protein